MSDATSPKKPAGPLYWCGHWTSLNVHPCQSCIEEYGKQTAYYRESDYLALVAERDRLIAERQRLTDENAKGVRALWDEKNRFMEALEVEMAEKKALIAECERLREEIDSDCLRIVAAEAEVARLREALAPFAGIVFADSAIAEEWILAARAALAAASTTTAPTPGDRRQR